MSYPVIHDDVNRAGDNAEVLSAMCIDNKLLVINNLMCGDRHFPGDETFRTRDTWISEIDTRV